MFKSTLARIIDRYKLNSYKYYDFFKKSQWWSRDELSQYQLNSLKNLFLKLNQRIDSWTEFKSLPFTTKNDLRNFKPPTDKKYHIHNTSGSTGYPLSIYLTHENWGMKEGIFLRHWEWMGRKDELVVRWISGEPKFAAFDWLRNVKPFNFRELNDDKIDWMIRYRPKYIHSTVFTARQIVEKLKERNELHILEDAKLWWTNENTEPHYKQMSQYFKDIYHGYGLAELTPVASQCEFKNLHVIMEMAIVEEIDGEIVVSNPFNEAMPIIRYKTGDRGQVVQSNCTCGRKSDIIANLKGKGVDFYDGPEFKTPIDWLIISPISKRYIDYISTWRVQVNVKNKTLNIYVKWKNNKYQSNLNWYRKWLENEVGLKLIVKSFDGEFNNKQLLEVK